ncbi:DUF4157 domain-containing protein [Dyella sp. 2HG41-7]|uniref:eCIS core domain-containing protein n=1 Tax=Dyella sp. 2HG41-7 TaxID=2883239 RepID=UPI001F2D38E6|nr:DUF4157 domain-containing protein [Dyella sp. 2HG41-7]
MDKRPAKPVGDVVRPASARKPSSTARNSAPNSTSRTKGPQASSKAAPPSSTHIPSLAPNERGAGRPLSPELQSHFGTRMHTDLSDVRIHTDEAAARLAADMRAKAYTVGKDIVFGAQRYQPETRSGERLLAHELAHTAQASDTAAQAVSKSTDESERDADRVADTVTRGDHATPRAKATTTVQRQPLNDTDAPKHEPLLDRMLDKASPFLAASTGSTTLNNFDTGKSDLKPNHLAELRKTAQTIAVLLRQYPNSTITIIGHTDTVGTEARNLALGQARASAAADALEKFGVPAAIVSTVSAGEGPPQAVKTKDEVPNAQNRRVEVRFDPKASPVPNIVPKLEPKKQETPSIFTQPPPPPMIDLRIHPKDDDSKYPPGPYRHDDAPPGMWKPIPPAPKGTGPKSPLDVIGEKIIDPVVDGVAHGLSKDMRDKIKQAARDAVKSGIAKSARAAAEAAGLKDPKGLDAIEKATEAAIQEKGTGGSNAP